MTMPINTQRACRKSMISFMSGELRFPFEELPLVIEQGWEAGLVNGEANVRYERDGEWDVTAIALDGYRAKRSGYLIEWQHKPIVLCPREHEQLRATILDRLESEPWRARIQDAVNKELAEAGIRIQSDFEQHSTLSRAMQGV